MWKSIPYHPLIPLPRRGTCYWEFFVKFVKLFNIFNFPKFLILYANKKRVPRRTLFLFGLWAID